MAKKKATPNAQAPKAAGKKAEKTPEKKVELPSDVDRSAFEEYPKASDSARVRFIPPSADVLFARAKIGAKEILASVADLETGRFTDQSTRFMDIGYKFTNGKRTEELSVRLHVQKKRKGVPLAPTCFNGRVCTDVLESNFKTATASTSAGDLISSSGNPGEFGTLGMGVVMDRGTSDAARTMFLTCAHVVSPVTPTTQSAFVIRDESDVPFGVADQFSSLFFENSNEFDVGIFAALKSVPVERRGGFDRLPVTPTSVNDPTREDVVNRTRVFKVGANSDSTIGVLDSLGPLFGDIPLENGLVAVEHFIVRSQTSGPFASEGDSGAIVVSEDGRILGMVRAVDEDSVGKRTIVTRMSKISARFEFNPVG